MMYLLCERNFFRTQKVVFFLFLSIGRVNPELYALGAHGRDLEASKELSESDIWMQNYANVLCVNSWQVLTLNFRFSITK